MSGSQRGAIVAVGLLLFAGGWASPDYEAAQRQAEIRIQGGVGSVRVA